FLARSIGTIPYLVLAFALFLLGPILLPIAFAKLWARGRPGGWDGLLLGAGVAAWASLCWLVGPYCGGYPCLPGLVLVMVLGASPVDAVWKELVVHVTNFLLWPGLGWALFQAKGPVYRAGRGAAADRPRDYGPPSSTAPPA